MEVSIKLNVFFEETFWVGIFEKRKINPKRYQREIKREVENKGIGTKA